MCFDCDFDDLSNIYMTLVIIMIFDSDDSYDHFDYLVFGFL